MDKLHREHEFIQSMWKFMKAAQQQSDMGSDAFWDRVQEAANQLSRKYGNMSFVNDWIVSFLKFLDEDGA